MSELEGGSSQIAASREYRYHRNVIRIAQNTKREDERSEMAVNIQAGDEAFFNERKNCYCKD